MKQPNPKEVTIPQRIEDDYEQCYSYLKYHAGLDRACGCGVLRPADVLPDRFVRADPRPNFTGRKRNDFDSPG